MEQDKSLNIWVGIIVAISHLHYLKSENIQEIDDYLVFEMTLAPIDDDFYDSLKDQHCMKNDNNLPQDYVFVQS